MASTYTTKYNIEKPAAGDYDDAWAPVLNSNFDAIDLALPPVASAPAAGLMTIIAITNGETVWSRKALFDTTNPAALGTAGPGTSLIAARRDHVHALPAVASTSGAGLCPTVGAQTPPEHGLVVAGVEWLETSYTTKQLFDFENPEGIGTASPGTSTRAAHRDHVHPPPTIGLLADIDEDLPNNTTTYLRGDGTWATPAGGGDTLSGATSADNTVARYNGTNNKTIQSSVVTIADTTGAISINAHQAITDPGASPSGKFLKDDGTWASPGATGTGVRYGAYVFSCHDSTADEKAASDDELAGDATDVTAINAIIAGGTCKEIHFLSGTVHIGDTAIALTDGVSLVGHGTTFDASAKATGYVLSITGSKGSDVALTGAAAAGDTQIATTTTSFAEGDLVRVASTDHWRTANYASAHQGEFQVVGSKDASNLYLRVVYNDTTPEYVGGLRDAYAQATSHVTKITPAGNLRVEGIAFTGRRDAYLKCVDLQYTRAVTFARCSFENFRERVINVTDSLDLKVRDCRFVGIDSGANPNHGLGYGVCIYGLNEHITVEGNYFEFCRHGTTIGGASTSYGIPRGILITGNTAFDCKTAYECHNLGEGIVITGNVAVGGREGVSANGVVMTITDNLFYNQVVWGIFLSKKEDTGGLDPELVLVAGNTILNPGEEGVDCRCAGAVIRGNYIRGAGHNGIESTMPCVIEGNTVLGSSRMHNNTYRQLYLNTASHGSAAGSLVRGNWLRTTSAGNQADYGIEVAATITPAVTIIDNDVTTSGSAGEIADSAGNSIIYGNIGYTSTRDINTAGAAAGDIIYHNGTSFVRLAKGSGGQVLTMNVGGTAPEWKTP